VADGDAAAAGAAGICAADRRDGNAAGGYLRLLGACSGSGAVTLDSGEVRVGLGNFAMQFDH
jgi:hypothetical protein